MSLCGFEPGAELVLDEGGHAIDPGGVVVEAGDEAQGFAAMFDEEFVCFVAHLIECFEAVGGEAWARDGDMFDAFFGEGFDGVIGVRLEPGFSAKTGLVSLDDVFFGHVEHGQQGLCGFGAHAAVGIAFDDVGFGDAVVGEDEAFGCGGEFVAGGVDGGGESLEEGGVFVVWLCDAQCGDKA